MLRSLVAVGLLLTSAEAWPASSPRTDAAAERYFAIWANNATVTPESVERYYAARVNYYGREMSPAEVYASKMYLVRSWPVRIYHVRPGSVITSCSEDKLRCETTLLLDWQSANPARHVGTQGETTFTLGCIEQGGRMKIERESGVPLATSTCQLLAPDWHQKSNWTCSAYKFPPVPSS